MVWVAGADGCRAGWFRASRELGSGALRFDRIERAADLLRRPPRPRVLALDMPIGLPEGGPRECDRQARVCLGPRRSSVFPVPIRPALRARSRAEASAITRRRDGRRVSVQSWALVPKIREVDALLAADPAARGRLREVHPELCFWAWNGGRPMAAPKRSRDGRRERLRLVESWLGARVARRARGELGACEVADDDILDALAALWSASRIARGIARTLPAEPAVDARGLRMEIAY